MLEGADRDTRDSKMGADRDTRDPKIRLKQRSVVVCRFARVGVLARLRIGDYYRQKLRVWFVLGKKRGQQNKALGHH